MKRILKLLVIGITTVLLLTGCTTRLSLTYNVATGDKIEVTLISNGGYDLGAGTPFKVLKDGKSLSEGTFLTMEGYNYYIRATQTDVNAKVIETKSENGITYTFYSYKNTEFNYVIKVDGSNTGILLGNPNSQEEAMECFRRLSFKVVR